MKCHLLIPAIILTLFPAPGHSFYFPQSVHRVYSIGDMKPGVPFYQLQGVLDADENPEKEKISYRISHQSNDTRCPVLDIDKAKGSVSIATKSEKPPLPGTIWVCKYTIRGSLRGRGGRRGELNGKAILSLIGGSHWDSDGSRHCSTLSNEALCFSGAQKVSLQAMENSVEIVGASLAYETSRCVDNLKMKYSFDSPASRSLEVYIGEGLEGFSQYAIRIKPNLDRELNDTYVYSLACEVSGDGRDSQVVKIPVTLRVIDQNDNLPMTQEKTHRENVSISLNNALNQYKPHQRLIQEYPSPLLFRDLDTVESNYFDLHIDGDYKGLLNITYEVVSVPGFDSGDYTAVMPKISLSEKASDIPWKGGLYCVVATFIDLAYVKGIESAFMQYRICLDGEQGVPTSFPLQADFQPQYDDTTSRSASLEFEQRSAGASVMQDEDKGCSGSCLIAVASGVILLACILVGSAYGCTWHFKKKKRTSQVQDMSVAESQSETQPGSAMALSNLEYIELQNHSADFGTNTTSITTLDTLDIMIDSEWEIPRTGLNLADVIGVGEFGRVYKAETDVIPGYEGIVLPVAVKILKDNHRESGKSCREEFQAEFSLLKQLDHPNVIKLLGACTTPGGPLYLVMEYAEFGSLRNFLRKCRRVEDLNISNMGACSSSRLVLSSMTDIESKNFIVHPQEILQFASQISRGMAYLSDMKMVHRDLAARNILLTGSKICKISDFGLTRDIYLDDAYKKKSKDRVPVKWLAPESLSDEIYTTKSDVWSFGILLWELTTLGASPYPGISAEDLYPLLTTGYRMHKPPNSSSDLYVLMKRCWASDPKDRPRFQELWASISKLLENGTDYMNLEGSQVSNPGYEHCSTELRNPSGYEPLAVEQDRATTQLSTQEQGQYYEGEFSKEDPKAVAGCGQLGCSCGCGRTQLCIQACHSLSTLSPSLSPDDTVPE